jgi:hypothetical protein
MGFSSEGLGCGCIFHFELPLYVQLQTLPNSDDSIKPLQNFSRWKKSSTLNNEVTLASSDENYYQSSTKLNVSEDSNRRHKALNVSTANTLNQFCNEFAVAPMEKGSFHSFRDGIDQLLCSDQSSVAVKPTQSTSHADSRINFDHVFHQMLRQRNYQGAIFCF